MATRTPHNHGRHRQGLVVAASTARRVLRARAFLALVGYPLLQYGVPRLMLTLDGETPFVVAVLGAPLIVGVLIARWWALALPGAVGGLALLVIYFLNPDCQHPSCGEDENWSNIPFLALLGVMPLILAMAVGVSLGKAWHSRHRFLSSSQRTRTGSLEGQAR